MSKLIYLGRQSRFKQGIQTAFCSGTGAKMMYGDYGFDEEGAHGLERLSCPTELYDRLEGDGADFNIATYGIITKDARSVNTSNSWPTEYDRSVVSYKKLLSIARNFIFVDHGYFMRSSGPASWDGYFSVCVNEKWATDKREYNWNRFNSLGIKLKKWRKSGDHIVLIPPSHHILDYLEHGSERGDVLVYDVSRDWESRTVEEIRRHTDRKIVISDKVNAPLSDCLQNAWCVVTSFSNAGIDAMIEGIPAIFTNPQRRMGELKDIEDPPVDREFFKMLANNQWTIKEIKKGKMWGQVKERYQCLD